MTGVKEQMLSRMKALHMEGFGRIWATPDEPFSVVEGDEWMVRQVTLYYGANASPEHALFLPWDKEGDYELSYAEWLWVIGGFNKFVVGEILKGHRGERRQVKFPVDASARAEQSQGSMNT